MQLEPGDLILVPFPYTDLSSKKMRPALVLSNATHNHQGSDVIALGVTSNLANAAHSILLKASDMVQGKLLATSRIKVDRVATLEQNLIRKRLGRVKPAILAQVMKEFLTLFPAAG